MQKLITLSPDITQFEANGTTYFIETEISAERNHYFQRFQREITTGVSFLQLIELLKTNCDNINAFIRGKDTLGQLFADNYNALSHANDLVSKEAYEIWVCTLFMNTKDEDRRKFELPVMQAKIRDWEEAGIEVGFFIACAENALGVPRGFLRSRIPNFLRSMQEENDQAEIQNP